jgi:hypothetical protein
MAGVTSFRKASHVMVTEFVVQQCTAGRHCEEGAIPKTLWGLSACTKAR